MDEQVAQGEINKKPSKAKIDPLNLLECLKILLSRNGGIKDVQSVHRLVVLMGKYSKKLVSKCMYLNILLATDRHILDTFLKDGGWKMVSEWLCEGIKKANWPLAGLVLDLLRASPITLERLNDSDLVMVKQVKSLSVSCPHPGVSEAAKLLVLAWTRMLTAATASDALTAPHEGDSTASPTAAGGGGGSAGPPDADASSAPGAEGSSAPADLAAQVQLEQAEENKDTTDALDASRSGDETASSPAAKSGETDEADSFGAMHQEPILPKYIPTKKPKLKNRSKFVVAKRFKSKSVPVSAVSDERTLVVQHAPSVLVVSPLPSAYIEHIAGVVGGGRPSSVLGGRRGRKKGQRARHTQDSSSGESESRSDSPQKRIKITIKSGSQVLAQVSSKKSAMPQEANTRALSKQYVDTDDDDDDDEEEDEEDDGEVKHGSKRMAEDSDEDFVVEWTDKCVPPKLNKTGDVPSKAMKMSSSLKRPKKKVRAIMIESDDSMDSLPNIDQGDVGAGLGSDLVKTEALVNGDSQVPYAKPGAAAAKPPQQEIKLKKFSVAKGEGADGAAPDSKAGKSVDSTTPDSKPLRSAESTAPDSKAGKSAEDDKDRSRHSSSSSSSGGKKNTKDKDRDKERSRGDDKDRNKVDRSKSDKDEKRKERDKDRRNSVSGDKKISSSSISKERDRERERRREKERRERKERDKDQLEKDRSTLEKVKPLSIDGLAKIPKKPPSFLDALGSADAGDSQVKKPPVKVKSSSFRSTGLLDPATPRPPGVAGKRVGPPTAPPQKTSANGATWPGPPAPSRKDPEVPRPGKRPPDLPLPGGADKRIKSTISSTPLTGDRPGGAKLISPKRPSLSDDGGFMAALDACSPKEVRRQKPPPPRRPRRPSDAERGEDGPDPAPRAASPPPAPPPAAAPPASLEASAPAEPGEEAGTAAPQRPPLNFYRDALEDLPSPDTGPPAPPPADPPAGDAAEGGAGGGDAAAGTPEGAEKDDAGTQEDNAEATASPDELYEKVEVTFAADAARPVRSALVLVRRPGPKKAVRFRPEDALEQVHYFELDQTERVNVNAQKFQDMLLLEKHGERDALDKHRGRPQTCVQLGPWQLLPVHLPEGAAAVVPGYKSLERHVQDKRQYSTMPTFFPPTRLPDTPQEPDPEPATARPEPPKAIPLNDTAGHDNVKSLKHIPWPDPVPTPPPQGPFYRHPQGPPWPRPMGGPPPPHKQPNGGPEYFPPPMEGMPMGGAADPMASTPPMGGPSGGAGGGHWVVGSATSAPHPLPKAADGPMFPGGGGGPMMGGPGSYGHPPMGPMPPMPHPGYGPPPGGAWGGRMDEGERGPFRDGGWRRGGGPRGRGWGRGGRPISKTPCRHFLKGGCRNGDDCGFAHTIP